MKIIYYNSRFCKECLINNYLMTNISNINQEIKKKNNRL